jgi:hypothetical protein
VKHDGATKQSCELHKCESDCRKGDGGRRDVNARLADGTALAVLPSFVPL